MARVKDNYDFRLKSGTWASGKAPFGFRNGKTADGKKTLIPVHEEMEAVRFMFKTYASKPNVSLVREYIDLLNQEINQLRRQTFRIGNCLGNLRAAGLPSQFLLLLFCLCRNGSIGVFCFENGCVTGSFFGFVGFHINLAHDILLKQGLLARLEKQLNNLIDLAMTSDSVSDVVKSRIEALTISINEKKLSMVFDDDDYTIGLRVHSDTNTPERTLLSAVSGYGDVLFEYKDLPVEKKQTVLRVLVKRVLPI